MPIDTPTLLQITQWYRSNRGPEGELPDMPEEEDGGSRKILNPIAPPPQVAEAAGKGGKAAAKPAAAKPAAAPAKGEPAAPWGSMWDSCMSVVPELLHLVQLHAALLYSSKHVCYAKLAAECSGSRMSMSQLSLQVQCSLQSTSPGCWRHTLL